MKRATRFGNDLDVLKFSNVNKYMICARHLVAYVEVIDHWAIVTFFSSMFY